MATTTTNYGLTKPEGSDFYDIGVQNDNMDIIDKQMKANAKDIAQLNSDKITGQRIKKLSWGGNELQCIEATIDENTVYIPIMWNTNHPFISSDGQVNNIAWDGDHSRLVIKIGTTDVYVPIQWN